MLTRQEWFDGCQEFYLQNGIIPGDPKEGQWEDAHAPKPECLGGDETTPMLHRHHIIHDLYQSEEFRHKCFFSYDVLKVLRSDWFKKRPWDIQSDCWRLYQEWSGEVGRRIHKLGIGCHDRSDLRNIEGSRKGGKIVGRENAELGRGIFDKSDPRNIEGWRKGGKISGKRNAELGLGVHNKSDPRVIEGKSKGGKKGGKICVKIINAQKWVSLADGFISHSGGVACHNKSIGAAKEARWRVPDSLKQHIDKNDRASNLALFAAYQQNPGVI